jgi:hypothetical protein
MLLMQSLAPMFNRRAVETLILHLVAVYPDCRVATTKRGGLRKDKFTHRLARRGDHLQDSLSNDRQNMPLPLSIETARWTGLTADEKSFMEYTYWKPMQHRLLGVRAAT